MAKTPTNRKTSKKTTGARKAPTRSRSTKVAGDKEPVDEITTLIDAENLEVFKAEALEHVEEIAASRLEDKVSERVQVEIKKLKKEVVDEVMNTIMPLLEALKKIRDEAPSTGADEEAVEGTATSAMGASVPSLEDMQKAALETIRTQEKLMTGSEHILEELEKARKLFAKGRRRGVKGYWLDQLLKNSSGENGGSDK
ncbi:MAG: hypothetical protein JJ850_01505 [Kordiimonadaceae bacterium]|nr:hypothetical protein [Kordiimonadaceae bacterium]MBO6567523.1 hypothetical protein [Kordiimonadaceae bacterium]MBO6963263.1 hypothetical protein [Kordiimonadaceae bacterium]